MKLKKRRKWSEMDINFFICLVSHIIHFISQYKATYLMFFSGTKETITCSTPHDSTEFTWISCWEFFYPTCRRIPVFLHCYLYRRHPLVLPVWNRTCALEVSKGSVFLIVKGNRQSRTRRQREPLSLQICQYPKSLFQRMAGRSHSFIEPKSLFLVFQFLSIVCNITK